MPQGTYSCHYVCKGKKFFTNLQIIRIGIFPHAFRENPFCFFLKMYNFANVKKQQLKNF